MFSNYKFIRSLGYGVNGPVILVQDSSTFNTYAVKRVVKFINNFINSEALREISIMKRLNHKNLMNMFCTNDEMHYYIFMVCMDCTLYDYSRQNTYSKNTIKYLFHEITTGIEHIHQHSIIHRDIKSQNVLLNYQGNVKISDFGK